MIVAIASGKGGTGKTTVSASLAALWDGATAVDLDVEEPNLHLFLKPELERIDKAYIEVPDLDEDKCTACGACRDLCQYKAITVMAGTTLVFPEMCHECGGCIAVCPEDALTPGKRELGEICQGKAGNTRFVMGRLRIGEAMSPPLMHQVKDHILSQGQAEDMIIDAPPGVSCPAISAVRDADAIVLVTEPTPFGLHDFKLAWEAFTPLDKPMGAVINRAGLGTDEVHRFCEERGIPIWAEIPFAPEVAEAYSRGRIIVDAVRGLRPTFQELKSHICGACGDPFHA